MKARLGISVAWVMMDIRIPWEAEIWWGPSLGYMRGVAYDTAHVARLGNGTVFPRSLIWLISMQKPDGSWGEDYPYYHDRVISTLAAIIALAEINPRKYETRIMAGLDYLWENASKIRYEEHSTVGFELLYPTLIEEAIQLRLDVPTFDLHYYTKLRDSKVRAILSDLLYTGNTTLSFSAEFMGENIDRKRAVRLFTDEGCVSNSPSATAYLLNQIGNRRALEYLESVERLNNNGSIADVYPFEIFEKSWLLYNFILAEQPVNDQILLHIKYLKQCLTPSGVGISRISGAKDSDDTAVVLTVLCHFKQKVDVSVLEAFEAEDRFLCFYFERDPSVSANVHILDALKRCPKIPRTSDMIEKTVRFLKKTRISKAYWKDKWHVSPYYVTSHAVIALAGIDDEMASSAVRWILESQNNNGSWGSNGGNPEETAYAIQALLYYHSNIEKIDLEPVKRGVKYLLDYDYYGKPMPALWIGKGLYIPETVVKSAIMSALYMYRNVMRREGKLCASAK